jgi:hypothetical protein
MRTIRPLQLFLFVVPILAIACGGSSEYIFVGGARTVGMDGVAQVETVEGGNQLVSLRLQHLPPPERLGEGLSAYVVWFRTEGQSPVRAGVLEFDPETRQGALTATTPMTDFTILITAEAEGDAPSPGEIVVTERAIRE